MAGLVRVGISGWRYAPWRGEFYPKGLPQRLELAYASRALSTIELNGSFYSLQTPQRYAEWREATPDGFVFSVKAPRFITHVRRLRDFDAPLANFMASGIFSLQEKLGPILWQFPPSFTFDPEQLEPFLAALPHDTDAAGRLAERHDAHLRGRAQTHSPRKWVMRHAMEIRNYSFVDERFVKLLRKYRVALVVADTAGRWPSCQDVTADFMYMRLHGDKELYASGYTDKALDDWAQHIDAWRHGRQPRNSPRISQDAPPARNTREVFCYFDNDIKVKAPYDAARLAQRLGAAQRLIDHAPILDELIPQG
ncbi:DUF72 domain-containing protein [Uliginosibacterium sp. sgz301328]|uniref:DUF72 domain-containing protein n=1 Tax=Uliginosibacterium sp. sgz301328 TaxID=3243764 RepID=UPI00359EA410